MALDLSFHLLGPFEVKRGALTVDLGTPRQRAVIAALVLEAGRPVPADRLIDQLWGDEAPAQATGTLQAYVSNLRRILEPDRPPRAPSAALLTRPSGYVLDTGPGQVDSVRFDAGVAEGRRLIATGSVAAGRDVLVDALGLWRGPALADFTDAPFARTARIHLEELRLGALEDRLDAELALGNHAGAVAELAHMVAEFPLRERLWALLMLALYRCGRQSEALRSFTRCREILAEQLGLDPGPSLQQLEAAVLGHDPALDWRPPSGSEPVAIRTTVPRTGAPVTLVGREEPLAVIDQALDALTAGEPGRLLLVAGEAGVGKTALAQETARRAQARNVTVAWGHGYEDDGAPAFWPWSEILGALLPPPGTTARDQVIGDDGPDLAPLLPGRTRRGTAESGKPDAPAEARFRLYQSTAALLGRLASERDVLVILDDLHWADAPSLGVLRFVAHQLSAGLGAGEAGPRLMVLATYRPAEAEMGPVLPDALATLTREPSVGRLQLSGLTPEAIAAFLHRASGREPAPDVVASLAGRTDGNPFYLGELVRLLQSEGDLTDAAAAAASRVPTGVRDVIRRRLVRLPERTTALLGVAAVTGREFDLRTLCAVAGLDAEAVFERVEPALASEMVVEHGTVAGRYRFSHALVRDTIYSGLPGMRRAGLHAQVAESILARSGGNTTGLTDARIADLAHHFMRAAPVVGAEVAVPHLFTAAESALRLLAWERAEELLRQALRLVQDMPPGSERARLELTVQVPLGNLLAITRGQAAPGVETAFARTKELCQAAGGSGPVPELVPALYGLLVACWFSGNFAGGIEQGQVLLDRAAETGDPFAALAGHQGLGMIRAHQGEVARAREHLETAIGIADALADPQLAFYLQGDPRMTCRGYLAFVLAAIGDHDGAAALTARAVAIVEDSEAPVSLASALLCDAWVAVVCGDVAHARVRADATVVLSEQYCLPLPGSMAKVCQGWVMARSGQTAEGLARLDEGLGDLAATGIRIWLPALLGLRAEVLVLAGSPHEALVTLDGALAAMEDSGDRCYESRLLALRSETRTALGPPPDHGKDPHGLHHPHQPG